MLYATTSYVECMRQMTNLIPKGKATQLRIVFKALNADGACPANDLEACNDRLALARICWGLLAALAGALLQAVQQGCEGHLLDGTVHMQHAVEADAEDALELEDADLGLEGRHTMHGSLGRAQHEAGQDIFLLNAAHSDAHLVAAHGLRELLLRLAV